jgi:hypoxanthine phosphoribosyltransferase
MADAPPPEILLSEQQIQKRVAELAAEIRRDCPDDVHLVAVLKGAFMFLSDLVRHMSGAGRSASWPCRATPRPEQFREVRMLKDLDSGLAGAT